MYQRLLHSKCGAHTGQQRVGDASAVRARRLRCNSSAEDSKPLSQTALDAARVRIEQDPRTQANLQRIDDAQRRVLELQAAQQQIQAEIDAAGSASSSGNGRSSNAAELAAMADEVSAAAHDFNAARDERDAAQHQQRQLRADLQRVGDIVQQEEDRLQSALAGAVAAAGGLLVQVPLLAGSQHPPAAKLASLIVAAISSGLFGIVWRYAVRSEQDAADTQLKAGCIAAFGLTLGLGQASALLGGALDQGEALSEQLLVQCALLTGASMLQFATAAVLLEACIMRQIVARTSR